MYSKTTSSIAIAFGFILMSSTIAGAASYRESATANVRKSARSGNRITYIGDVNSKVFGRGRVTQVVKVTGFTNQGTFTTRYAKGTVYGTSSVKATPQLNGRVKFSGTFKITGGTGRYRFASGQGRISGTGSLNLSGATSTQSGSVTLRG